jgi:flagellar assembly protein FliH
MSSFEPLFTGASGTRIARHNAPTLGTVNAWMPRAVLSPADTRPSWFDEELEDVRESAVAVQEAAAAAAHAARRQAEIDDAYQRGVHDGREQGEMAERARLRGAVVAAECALDDIREGEVRWLSHLEENVAAIAVAVAQQVIVREVSVEREIVSALVSRAVQEFGLDQALTIRVNPGDLETLSAVTRRDDAEGPVSPPRDVRWVGDARIEPGGCVVEGRERIVDGRVDTSLERLYRRLTHTNA